MLYINNNEFIELTTYIKQNFGINLTHKKTLIEGRLSNLIVEKGFKDFEHYLKHVFTDNTGQEMTLLINKLTTNHTYFLREPSHFEFLKNIVLPEYIDKIKDKDLRIWSAGCSSGEEPYTIAMIIDELLGERKALWDSKILATDISMRVLDKAIEGKYFEESIKNISNTWKLKYFVREDSEIYRITEAMRKEVIFRVFNLMQESFPFKRKFHVIFCRNVMIYFDNETKRKLINRFYEYTEPGGYLFIGHSESINRELTRYKYIMPAVYRKEII